MGSKIFNRKNIPYLFIIILCSLYALAASLINIHRYWQFDLGYYDFGIFDTAIWKVSRFTSPIIDHFMVPGKIIFADHFNPSIFLLTPLYWITSRGETLLVAQSVMVGLSGFILFKIGMRVLRNVFYSISIVVAYFFFVGLQNAVYSDFHELTVMTLFLMLVYYCFFSENKKLFLLFFILTLGFKESLFLLGIGISFFVFFSKPSWWRVAVFCLIYSLLYGLIVIKFIIPYFSGGLYNYTPIFNKSLEDLFYSLFQPIIKLKTVFFIYLSFFFLPLISFTIQPIIFLNLFHRFVTEGAIRWDLGLHYNAEIAPTLAIASILAVYKIQRAYKGKLALIVIFGLLFTTIFLHRFVLHGPISLAVHPAFYANTKNHDFLKRMISAVPAKGTIVAQNNLTVPFLHREGVWILKEDYSKYQADYILIDMRKGQNPSGQLGIKNPQALFQTILKDKNYRIFYKNGDQYIFKKVW